MYKLKRKITAIILTIALMLISLPNVNVFGDTIESEVITIEVLNGNGDAIADAKIMINNQPVEAIYDNGKYQLELSGYQIEGLEISVCNSDETIKKSITYEQGKTEYSVILTKDLLMNNKEATYDNEKNVYIIETNYSEAKGYILNVSEDDDKNGEVSFFVENIDEQTASEEVSIEATNNKNSVNVKYETPGIIRVKCTSLSNRHIYNDIIVELHIKNNLIYKYSKNDSIGSKYQVSQKQGKDEVDTVTISGKNIVNNFVDVNLNLTADCLSDVEYSLTNTDGFSVDNNGKVICTKIGNTVVEARSKKTGAVAKYKINIEASSSNIVIREKIDNNEISNNQKVEINILDYRGENAKYGIYATVKAADMYKMVKYDTSNRDIAEISDNGDITIKGVGRVQITVSAKNESIWWEEISTSFWLEVKPAIPTLEVKFGDTVLSENEILELEDNGTYMEYDEVGNGKKFTIPVEVNVLDKDGNKIDTDVTFTSDGLNIEGYDVKNPDNIIRNEIKEYKIATSPKGIYDGVEYTLRIRLKGSKDNNNGYYTVDSGLKIGADGNLWSVGKEIPVILKGNTIVSDQETGEEYTFQMSDNINDVFSYEEIYNIEVGNTPMPINKQHLFYIMNEKGKRITQRIYFGVDFHSPTIKSVTTDANVTKYGIYSSDSISITITGCDINEKDSDATGKGNLYKAYIVDSNTDVIIKSGFFASGDEQVDTGSITLTFNEKLSEVQNYSVYVEDRAGNRSAKIPLTKAIYNIENGKTVEEENPDVAGNEFLIEDGGVEVSFNLNDEQSGNAIHKVKDNKIYYNQNVTIDIDFNDTGVNGQKGEQKVSGIKEYVIEIHTSDKTITIPYSNQASNNGETKKIGIKTSIDTKNCSIGSDGKITFVVKAVDNAGNTNVTTSTDLAQVNNGNTTVSYTIYIDEAEPTPKLIEAAPIDYENIKSYGNYYNKGVKLTFELNDSVSGVDTAILNIDNKSYQGNLIIKDGKTLVTYKIDNNIKGNVTLELTDFVENSESYKLKDIPYNNSREGKYTSSYMVVEDFKPNVTVKETRKPDSNNKWYNKSVGFDISVKESNVVSGINRVEVFVNDNKVISDIYDVKDKETDSKKLVLTNDLIEKYVNETGSYTVKAIVTDNAGNEDQAEKTVYIDTTAPIINDLSGVENESYNTGVVTVITSVAEKHFSEVGNETTAYVTRTLDGVTEKYQLEAEAAKEADNQYSFVFDKDGTYEVIVKSIDAAGNAAAEKSIKFTLDNTSPFCEITGVTENAYYADKAEMTLKVIESNYDTNVVDISIVRRLNNNEYRDYDLSFNGTKKEDVLNYTFADEGTYTLRVQAKDKAGNTALTRTVIFTVDTAAPEITITGVTDMGAYNDSVIPSINISDNYFDNYSVSLTKTGVYFTDEYRNIESIKDLDVTNQFINGMENIEKGVKGSFDTFAKKRENDGLYVLTVVAKDKAGRVSQKQVTFSLNRYGSVYTFNDVLNNVMNGYVKEVEGDFVITEYNVNTLTQLSMEVARDGAKVTDLIYEATPLDNSKARGDNGWYKYQYTISKENFVKDGIYVISTTSKDKAGNVSQTLVYDNLYATFAVDNTKPEIVMVSGMEKGTYNADEITVKYKLFDALGVKEVRVYSNGEEIYKANQFNDNMDFEDTFNIKAGVNQKIRFEVEDMAGNVTDSENAEDIASGKVVSFNNTVTVTTNFFVRWYSNKAAFFGSVGGVVAAMVGAFALIYMKTGRGYRKKHTIREETLK